MSSKKRNARRQAGNVLVRDGKTGRSYCIRYRTADGRRHFEVVGRDADGTTKEDAERALKERLAAVTLGTWEDPRRAVRPVDHEPSMQEMVELWLESKAISIVADDHGRNRLSGAAYSDSTLTRLRSAVQHILTFFADPPRAGSSRSWLISEISPREVQAFINAKRKQGLKGSTIKKMGSVLVDVFELAVEYEHLSRNPATRRFRELKTEPPRRTHLSFASEIEALLEGAAEMDARSYGGVTHHRAFISSLVFGGLRLAEALSLRWRHVDLARGLMEVPGTKTSAAARTADIVAPLREALAVVKPLDVDRDAPVFPTARGTKQDTHNARNRWFAEALKVGTELRVERGDDPLPDLTPHGLRHTFVSLAAATGWDLPRIAEHVGHRDISFTYSTYCHTMKRRDGELERLRALMDGEDLTRAAAVRGDAASQRVE